MSRAGFGGLTCLAIASMFFWGHGVFSVWNEMSWICSTVLAITHILHLACAARLSRRSCESADLRSVRVVLESTCNSIVLRVLNEDSSVGVVEEEEDDSFVMVCWSKELREGCRCDPYSALWRTQNLC